MPAVAIQGEPGSFSELAARRLAPDSTTLTCRSFAEVARAVAGGTAERGILPVANSLIGEVLDLEALLTTFSLGVVDELSLPVDLCLIGRDAVPLEAVREVRSHPAALAQCRRFFASHPWIQPVEVEDTAGAVREVCAEGRGDLAAVAGAAAAERYGATVLARGIADRPDGTTRFVLVTRKPRPDA